MRPPMHQTAKKQVTSRNAYGDYSVSSTTTLKCHFRRITEAVTGSSNETTQSDAMAWFEPDAGIEENDILEIHGEFYRVERLIKARKLRNPTVQFIKTELLKYGTIS